MIFKVIRSFANNTGPKKPLRKICQGTVFLWPIFPRIFDSVLIQENPVQKNPYSGIFYTVAVQEGHLLRKKDNTWDLEYEIKILNFGYVGQFCTVFNKNSVKPEL